MFNNNQPVTADGGSNNENDASTFFDVYQPSSDETKKHYEKLLTQLRKLNVDNANEFSSLSAVADDVIDICKDVDIAFSDRQKNLKELLGIDVNNDTVRNISLLCDKLTDYVQSSTRQNLQQQNKNKNADDATTANNENKSDDDATRKLFNFSVGNVLDRSAYERRGGAGVAFGRGDTDNIDDNNNAFVDSLINDDAAEDNNNNTDIDPSSNNNKKGSSATTTFLKDRRFHPLTMESTFLTDAFTRLFPDLPAPDRLLLESELRQQLGNTRTDDVTLRAQLPLRINPDSKQSVSIFLNQVIDHRWHIYYGLMMAEKRENNINNNSEVEGDDEDDGIQNIIEELRSFAKMDVSPGDRSGFLLRRKLRGVLRLVSKSEIDQFEEDQQDEENNNNLNQGGDEVLDENNKNISNDQIQRRGEDLNIVDFAIHHPMAQGNRVIAAQQQNQKNNANNNNNSSNSGFFRGGGQQDSSLVLPEGSQIERRPDFSEVIIPMPPQIRIEAKDRVKLSVAFPDWAHRAFPPGFESLNAMQSKVYPSVFRSDRNVLVCAPTGAGKTAIAIMSCLRAVERYGEFEVEGDNDNYNDDGNDEIENNNNNRNQRKLRYIGPGTGWKIIYIAPMVALAREVEGKLSQALGSLGVNVAELSGDSALSQQEMKDIHVLVATPEKWDIVSRKTLDLGAAAEVKLIIFDEIHMLHSERGAVVESIAARTLHQIERTCEPVRFVGLSATLPNYEDVAQFLRVNVAKGDLHFFHGGYRPCPLRQTFACPERNNLNNNDGTNNKFLSKKSTVSLEEICYTKIQEMLPDGPIMVFVHSRKDTIRTAEHILELAVKNGFQSELAKSVGDLSDSPPARSDKLRTLLQAGLGIHHAGLTLDDKRLVENLFGAKRLAVLVCTATLAWGVNLPAHTVIIKGTKIYSASSGGWTDLSILDTLQMFGRAGRPGLDTSGDAVILTSDKDNLKKYLKFLTVQDPVESHLLLKAMEAINAEVALGSVSNLKQCVKWFKFTWFYTRMLAAPRLYGVLQADLSKDPSLTLLSEDICHTTLKKLHECELVIYDDLEGTCHPTDLGRITSFFNLSFATTRNIVTKLRETMLEHELIDIFASCQEFSSIRVRDEELEDLRSWRKKCPMPIENQDEQDGAAKVNILTQLAISNGRLEGRNLASDLELIKDSNSTRITKAIHEIALVKGWANTASLALKLHQQLKHRQWQAQCPLRQFGSHASEEVIRRLEASRADWLTLKLSDEESLVEFVSDPRYAEEAFSLIQKIPQLTFVHVVSVAQSRAFLKLEVALQPDFAFDEDIHPYNQPINFLMTIEDGDGSNILFQERIAVTRQAIEGGELITVPCFVRLRDPKPASYFARCVAVEWLGSTTTKPIDLRSLLQPDPSQPSTAPAAPPQSEEDYPIINNEQDHHALFSYIPEETGWNPAQLTAFNTLFRRRTNTMVSCPLGCGREALHSMIVAQFLDNFDEFQRAKKDGGLNANLLSEVLGSSEKIFNGRLLFVSPVLDCAQRRFNFFRTAMKKSDQLRKESEEDLQPRNTRVRVLSGISSVDSKLVFGGQQDDNSASVSASPLIVVATPARLTRLATSYPEIFEAFDVVIFDHLHTISHMTFPKSGCSGVVTTNTSTNQQDEAGGEDDADAMQFQEEDSSENLLQNNDQSFNYFASPNSSLFDSDSQGGSVRYAELIQSFVETQTQRNKQLSKKLASANSSSADQISPFILNRIVGFSSLSTHADNVLAKFLKVPAVSVTKDDPSSSPSILQLSKPIFRQRTVALEVQEIPKHEDREASAMNHVFRLLTEKQYVASSVLVFTPTQRQAEQMAETLMLQYRDADMVLHPHLKNENDKSNNNNDFKLKEDDGNNDKKEENNNNETNKQKQLQDPLLQDYCPSGVAILSPQTTPNDFELVLTTAKDHEKMVCFVPMTLAGRIPSGMFQYCFVCFSQTLQTISTSRVSAQSPLVDVDVPTMLLMISRSAVESKLWCTTSRQKFWDRVLNDPLPCLPLLSVSIAPSFRPFLKSYQEDEDKLHKEMMPHFVAENILEYCLTEACLLSAASPSGTIDEQTLFSRIQKNICFAAAKFTPFAYGLPGPSQSDLLEFFAVVVEKVFNRLSGLRAVKKRVITTNNNQELSSDSASNAASTTVLAPTVFGKLIAKYQLSVIDCGRIVHFCNNNSTEQSSPSEASILLLACQMSCICASSSLITAPSERRLLREFAHFFASTSQSVFDPTSLYGTHNEASFVSSSAGKAFILVLLHCSGKLAVGENNGVILGANNDGSSTSATPSVCLRNIIESLKTFMQEENDFHIPSGNSLFFNRLPLSDWLRQLSQILDNLISVVLPALVEFTSKKSASWMNVVVSVLRKVTTGVQLSSASSSVSSSSTSLKQLPGFESLARLQLCVKNKVARAEDIGAIEDDIREKLFEGLSESCVESIAEFVNACPVIETTAQVKFDQENGVAAVRCVIESAVEDSSDDQQQSVVNSLPVTACTPRFTHLLRMSGKTSLTDDENEQENSDNELYSLPSVAVAAKFLVTVRLQNSPNVIRASRIITLAKVREAVVMKFQMSEEDDGKIVVDVRSLVYDVDSQCSCE